VLKGAAAIENACGVNVLGVSAWASTTGMPAFCNCCSPKAIPAFEAVAETRPA
jgi:hypothetical protein